jgi:starch synthase
MPRKSSAQNILKQVVSELLQSKPAKSNGSLKILFVATELSPYATVGGMGRVAHFLPKALTALGHDVRVMIPKYGKIDQDIYKMELVIKGLKVPTGEKGHFISCNVKTHQVKSGPVGYFLENMEYYEKRANEYGYSDDPIRWALLQRAAL